MRCPRATAVSGVAARRTTRRNLCNPCPLERSLTAFGMTRFFIFALLQVLFRHADFPPDAAAFDVSLVHRLGENGRHCELAALSRFDLIIDLERAAGQENPPFFCLT